MPLTDRELLDRYLTHRDEQAFQSLVERHLPLVHGVARRVTGSDDLAREASQQTLIRLAERAALVPRDVNLSAWLHRMARHVAVDLVRAEDRRKKREHRHYDLTSLTTAMDPSPEPDWTALSPLLDELVDALPAADRELLLLRFYENQSHRDVARQLGLSEETARKRALRALERLRALLKRRGIPITGAALATLLPAHAATPVPAAFIRTVAGATHGVTPLVPHGLSVRLAMTSFQKSSIAAAALIFLASAGYSFFPTVSGVDAAASASRGHGSSDPDGPGNPRPRTERRVPGTPEARRERLREILSMVSLPQRQRELLAYLDELTPALFRETAGYLPEIYTGTGETSYSLMTIFSAWTAVDPLGAADWALAHPEEVHPEGVLLSWGERDPGAALAWVVEHFQVRENAGEQDEPLVLATSALTGLALRDPVAAAQALEVIGDPARRQRALQMLARDCYGYDRDVMGKMLTGMEPGADRTALLVFSSRQMLVSGRAEQAVDLLLEDDAARKDMPLSDCFRLWVDNGSAEQALARLETLPPGAERDAAVTGYCLARAGMDFTATLKLLLDHPGAATDATVAEIAQKATLRDIQPSMAAILNLHDPAVRDDVLIRQMRKWKRIDEKGMREWAGQHDLSETVRQSVLSPAAATPTTPQPR